MAQDFVLEQMKKDNIPETRENYLELAYLGTPPAELDAEEEAAMPGNLQKEEKENVEE